MGTLINKRRMQRPATFTCQGRIITAERQNTRSDLGFVLYRIQIPNGTFYAFQWDKSGHRLQPVSEGNTVRLAGRWTGMPEKSNIQIAEIHHLDGKSSVSLVNTLRQSPRQDLIQNLSSWLNNLRPPLREFVTDVLSDPAIGVPFVTLPASLFHHHSEPGGLLEHSWECVITSGNAGCRTLNRSELELTTVAAFFHDVGKVRTYKDTQSLSATGHTVPHQAITLEVLSPYLAKLDQTWRQGANILRHILTWGMSQSQFPEFPGTLLVRAADHFSTAVYCRTKAFRSHPDYHWKARSENCQKQWFLRVPE